MITVVLNNDDIDALSPLAQAEASGIAQYYARNVSVFENGPEVAYTSIVGSVLNRVACDTWYGHSIEEVINKPYQYEPVTRMVGRGEIFLLLAPKLRIM